MSWIDARTFEALGNERYRGLAFGWIFLALHGVLNLGRGSIHTFRSDGGASSIAGIDLSQNGEVILTLFATMGISQLLMGGIELAVAFRFRALVPLFVAYLFVQQIAAALVVWWWRPLPLNAPGKFGALVLIPVIVVALYCAQRPRRDRVGSIDSTHTRQGVSA